MSKWTTTAGPRQTKQACEALDKLRRLAQTYVEVSGVVGGEEHRTTLWSPFGKVENPSFNKAWQEVGEAFGWAITRDNYQAVIAAALEAAKNVELPVVDKRRTQAEVDADNAAAQAAKAKREADEAAFIAAHCLPERVEVPAGQMAVTVTMTYDMSDPMSDYFSPHVPYGPDMLLAIVPKQARTEALARSVLSRYPTLAALEWTWHKEEYSNGHGTYLMSQYTTETAPLHGVRDENPVLKYEIAISPYILTRTMYAWHEYPGQAPAFEPAAEPVQGASGVEIRENAEKNGLEIRFPSKPAEAVLSSLKAHGWRWSRFSKCWYTKRSDRAREFTQTLIA